MAGFQNVKNEDYTLGRGRLYFGQFGASKVPGTYPWDFLGNVPEFNISVKSEKLDHFQSTGGVKEKDRSVTLSTDRSATIKSDNMIMQNLARFFMGAATSVAALALTVVDEVIDGDLVVKGKMFRVGVTPSSIAGVRNITAGSVVLTNSAGSTTYVEGTDYEVDYESGMILPLLGGAIVNNADLKVDYNVAANTHERVVSGPDSIEGAVLFQSDNPEGTNKDYLMPYVRLSPNGELKLIGDTWQEVDFMVEILVLKPYAAVQIDGRTFIA